MLLALQAALSALIDYIYGGQPEVSVDDCMQMPTIYQSYPSGAKLCIQHEDFRKLSATQLMWIVQREDLHVSREDGHLPMVQQFQSWR